ncbi:HAD family acid phosphatase [Streptomyces celluloflavus]|uniref:Acid phosphatase n=1 Tax=Streptomyces kasugaensis TaxID=1946 RepID=A0A4Q9HZ48_STRKA|nr:MULTISPECIES: HAD family acid phosphatase [Streptomyces]MYU55183.1 acid phosphatase [Streptomyces sp. SID7805]TBO60628.1 acid phosphatase [Streptomyces kasugaensis]
MPLPALSRRTRLGAAVVTALVAGTAVFGIGQATAEHSVPRTDKEIPNLTLVQDQIKAYYGDKVTADGEHYASPDSNYGRQVRDIEAKARTYLTKALAKYRAQSGAHKPGHGGKPVKPAIVLDMDDTTLLTYNYELQVGFHFTEASQDKYLATKDMDAVFGMDRLVNWAHDKGAEVFFLTGRKEAQRAWSVRNLKNVGYDVPLDRKHVYLKDKEHPPAYLPCGATCSTIGFKSGTRKHIESLGYDIVANFGDQYSDLQGGAGDRTFKMPNPMYYLP